MSMFREAKCRILPLNLLILCLNWTLSKIISKILLKMSNLTSSSSICNRLSYLTSICNSWFDNSMSSLPVKFYELDLLSSSRLVNLMSWKWSCSVFKVFSKSSCRLMRKEETRKLFRSEITYK